MARSKSQHKPPSHSPHAAAAHSSVRPSPRPARTVSGRWLLSAVAIALPAAFLCAWGVLCLLFWQGSWQLLYHPASTVARTPAEIGLAFDPVGFATSETGAPQLQGWWIPAASPARYTVLFLHGKDGNLGDTLEDLERLHSASVNVLVFDYRGFGQSVFAHPGEVHMRQDVAWALQYLTATRHVDPRTIVLEGSGLGANLALEVAATHPELAGVVLVSPLDDPVRAIFDDPRSHLVPAHVLVSDRFDMIAPSAALRIPSLWFVPDSPAGKAASSETQQAFQDVTAPKVRVRLLASRSSRQDFIDAFSRWLDDLNN